MIIELINISKTFIRPLTRQSFAKVLSPAKHKRMHVHAFHGFNGSLQRGSIAVIRAANGKGKSTLLKIIAGLYQPTEGKCIVNGSVMPLLAPGPAMYSNLEVEDNIKHFFLLNGFSRADAKISCEQILKDLALTEKSDHFLFQLSRGQLCAVSLLCGFLVPKDLYLIDELLDPLDQTYRTIVLNRLHEVQKNGASAIIVSHDADLIETVGTTQWTL